MPLPRQIAYSAVARFPTAPVAASRIQADLRGMLDRSSMIDNPAGVQLMVGDGNQVVLRGACQG